jgi:hypothetical protein
MLSGGLAKGYPDRRRVHLTVGLPPAILREILRSAIIRSVSVETNLLAFVSTE